MWEQLQLGEMLERSQRSIPQSGVQWPSSHGHELQLDGMCDSHLSCMKAFFNGHDKSGNPTTTTLQEAERLLPCSGLSQEREVSLAAQESATLASL